MPQKPLRERLISTLESLGYRPVASRTAKYTVLAQPADCPAPYPQYAFVGKCGALRFAHVNASTKTTSRDAHVFLERHEPDECVQAAQAALDRMKEGATCR